MSEQRAMKKKLTLTPYREMHTYLKRITDREPFYVMLNPDSITINAATEYEPGALRRLMFKAYMRPTITIPTLYFDVTGAIPKSEWPQGCSTIMDMILFLEDTVYTYDNESHQTPVVEVSWGAISYYARVKNFKTKYTLFDPEGMPLRAEVNLDFESFYTNSPSDYPEDKKSPDLTHLVAVKAGDTLPLMCDRVYNDSSYYLQIARINGLTNFRNLKPGTMLEFPPIRD